MSIAGAHGLQCTDSFVSTFFFGSLLFIYFTIDRQQDEYTEKTLVLATTSS